MIKDKRMEIVMSLLLLVAAFLLATRGARQVSQARVQNEKPVIVIDAGHGGDDPGKVGAAGTKEREINLQIAQKLQHLLEEKGISVVMTREDAQGLYDRNVENKKQDDMRKRCERIDGAGALFTISIHQNSYTDESVHGPQVFYYTHSEEGERLAAEIQEAMNTTLEVDRPRASKANDTYYLLKKTKTPTVIVECGFLSNHEEEAKLVTEEYQQKVAEAICQGVLPFFR